MSDIPAPPQGASAAELAGWAVDTGRIPPDLEDALASQIGPGFLGRAHIVNSPAGHYDNSGSSRTQARLAARAQAKQDEILREIAQVKAKVAVSARVAASYSRPSLPGAKDALTEQYARNTGRPVGKVMASAAGAAPEPFPGSGDVPLATASGMDPALLKQAPWQERWAIAKAPTMAEAAERLSTSVGLAADFGDLPTSWPPSGLDGDAQAYVNDFRRWLSGFPPGGGPQF